MCGGECKTFEKWAQGRLACRVFLFTATPAVLARACLPNVVVTPRSTPRRTMLSAGENPAPSSSSVSHCRRTLACSGSCLGRRPLCSCHARVWRRGCWKSVPSAGTKALLFFWLAPYPLRALLNVWRRQPVVSASPQPSKLSSRGRPVTAAARTFSIPPP